LWKKIMLDLIPRHLIFVRCCPRNTTECVDSLRPFAGLEPLNDSAAPPAAICERLQQEDANLTVNEMDALACNVHRSIRIQRPARVLFYNDSRCAECIRKAQPGATGEALVTAFAHRMQGIHKSDLCRVCALYEHGGCYADNDMFSIAPLWHLLPSGTTIASVLSTGSKADKFPTQVATMEPSLVSSLPAAVRAALPVQVRRDVVQLFQSLICAAPGHTVLLRAMNITLGLEIASTASRQKRLAALPIHRHFRTLDYRELNTATLARAWSDWTGRPLQAGWDPVHRALLFAECSLQHSTALALRWPQQLGPRWLWQRHGCEYAVLDLSTGQVPWLARFHAVGVDAGKPCGDRSERAGPLTLSQWLPVPPPPPVSTALASPAWPLASSLRLGGAHHGARGTTPAPITAPNTAPITAPITVHLLAPADTTRWSRWLHSWQVAQGFEVRLWHDEDLPPIVREVASKHATRILAFRTPVELYDVARYCILWKYGGIYADLDVELRSGRVQLLRQLADYALAQQTVLLPLEKQQVGQCFMISPARHPFWLDLINAIVAAYDPACYEPTNTGPGAVTIAYNELCLRHQYNGHTRPSEMPDSSPKHLCSRPPEWRRL